MAEARKRDAWDRESILLSMFFNANKGPGVSARSPDDFNPFAQEDAELLPKPKPVLMPIQVLKVMLQPQLRS